ncbi:MAG: hypothetical protein QOI95_1124 [Acidimicrobiaceae bacterium]|jgi:hypothetical protein
MPIIPIFVSSTFRDFHAERDRLVGDVRAALDDNVADLGCRVEMIDLRWRIDTTAIDDESVQQSRVMDVRSTKARCPQPPDRGAHTRSHSRAWVSRGMMCGPSDEAPRKPITESLNLCALCPLHHRLHHHGLLEIRGNPNRRDGLHFFDKQGREIAAPPKAPPERPLHPPSKPYVHPSGEPINWYWFDWRDLERERDLN